MDTRKVTLIATIAVIVLIAVGVGYAYTASTQNTGNTVTTEYITLVEGGDGAYKFSNNYEIEWNTVDKKVGEKPQTEYTIIGMEQGDADHHMAGFNIKQIGNSFTVLTETTGIDSHPDLQCTITRGSDWTHEQNKTTFFLKVQNNNDITWYKQGDENWSQFFKYNTESGKWDLASIFTIAYDSEHSKYFDTTVTVYYAIVGSAVVIEHDPGVMPAGAPSAKPLNSALLEFRITRS